MQQATLTFCLAAAFGVVLIIVSQRLNIPSIVMLLAGGVILGPEVLGWVDPASLGRGLETLVSLLVAVILFEGGLTLDISGYRRASGVIRRLLTLGPLITWLGGGVAIYLLFDLKPGMALMAASLVIVTGPTVVLPLLRRLHVKERLHQVLYWEAVLIDPVGVFIAVLCYEWLTPFEGQAVVTPLAHLGLRLLVGTGLGLMGGLVTSWMLEKTGMGAQQSNLFVLACALLTFGGAHAVINESGILAMVVAGLVVALRRPPQLRFVKQFKLQLTEFGIGLLFILLSAKLELSQFTGWDLLALLLVLILVIRPVVIWLSTYGKQFQLREKLFLSWIAPRGIVAAVMASLFTLRFEALGRPEAVTFETITFAVIATTVTLQGLSAPVVARLLGLTYPDLRTWVLLGENALVLALARGLRRAGVSVIELFGGRDDVEVDIDDPRFSGVAAMLCAHPTELQNILEVQRWTGRIPAESCYRWTTHPVESQEDGREGQIIGTAIRPGSLPAADVAHGLTSGVLSIDVVEVGDPEERGRFGKDIQPLFWVKEGRATLNLDPLKPDPAGADLAVVLRRRIPRLADLIAHVDLVDAGTPTFESVLQTMAESAHRLYPTLEMREVVAGIIDRWRTMTVAVGSGVAIPHAYCEGLQESRCFLAIVPRGLSMDTPDERPVHLVFLLVSPEGRATEHLESLAALAQLAEDREFLDLLSRQRAPERAARFILERA